MTNKVLRCYYMDYCIFCRIIKGEIPSYTIYQDVKTLAFLDIDPNTRGHTLVIPKKHARNIIDMEDRDVEAVFRTVKKVVSSMKVSLDLDGLNLVVNQGEVAGQVIHHFHCHIIPRYVDDGIKYSSKGYSSSSEELEELAGKISGNIK